MTAISPLEASSFLKITSKTQLLSFIQAFADDCMAHSCTLIENKMFFHQNATESTEVYTPSRSSQFSLFGGSLKEKTVEEKNSHYYKYQIAKSGILKIKTCVKKAVDMRDNPYCLLSKAATNGKLLPNTEQLKDVRKRVGYFISESCTYRCDEMFYKYIEIIPYKGETLESLLLDEQEESKQEWAGKLIQACLEQVAEKGIVHTDLKPANICVLDDVITIIDFDNAFIPELDHLPTGLGTPGYIAPELFQNIEDATQQCEIYNQGDEHWVAALKADFRELFTTATIFLP